jgi:hypothetical protein
VADGPDADPRVDELFALPPEEFTAARNALATALRGDGDRERAAEVTRMRRPTVAAWAVNQTVRRHRDRFDELLAAGARVRTAQRRALSGVRASGMRDATRVRRAAIEALADAAVTILTGHGVAAESHRGDIVATFDAASADEQAAAVVGAARLSATLPVASGFGALDGLQLVTAPDADGAATAVDSDAAAADAAADDVTGPDAAEARERARREEERAEVRRAAMRAVADARWRLADAQGTADRADAEASRASARADAADQTATVAEDKARRLRQEAEQLAERAARASDRAADAHRTADDRTGELDAAQALLTALDD